MKTARSPRQAIRFARHLRLGDGATFEVIRAELAARGFGQYAANDVRAMIGTSPQWLARAWAETAPRDGARRGFLLVLAQERGLLEELRDLVNADRTGRE